VASRSSHRYRLRGVYRDVQVRSPTRSSRSQHPHRLTRQDDNDVGFGLIVGDCAHAAPRRLRLRRLRLRRLRLRGLSLRGLRGLRLRGLRLRGLRGLRGLRAEPS